MRADCCDVEKHGTGGNKACWDDNFRFECCCSEPPTPTRNLPPREEFSNFFLEDSIEVGAIDQSEESYIEVGGHTVRDIEMSRADILSSFDVRFDFNTVSAAAAAAVAGETQDARPATLVAKLPVRIYMYDLPPCAGAMVLERFKRKHRNTCVNGHWDNFRRQQVEHLIALDAAILRSGAFVTNPYDATVFYVRAFWSLLIEEMNDWVQLLDAGLSVAEADLRMEVPSEDTGGTCITRVFESLRQSRFYTRNAAYDHFWVAGIQHPFNPSSQPASHIEKYDPLAKNMIVMASAVYEYGFSDPLFEWGSPMYGALRRIFVPYSTMVNCRRLATLARSLEKRPLAIAFMASPTSRMRHWTRELSQEPAFVADRRLVLRFGEVDEVQAASRGEQSAAWELAGNTTRLYENSDFCLVLPGHLHDMTKRCYDAMAQGCLPVVITKFRFWMALPFPSLVPWREFSMFKRVETKAELRGILQTLLDLHEHDQEDIRRRRLALSRNAGLFAAHVRGACSGEERAAFPKLLLEELRARQMVWPHLRSAWLFDD